jgi:hypothetical protein
MSVSQLRQTVGLGLVCVLLAAGAWEPALWPRLGLKVPQSPIDQTQASRPASSPPSRFCEHQPAIRVASLLPSAFPA